MGRQHSTTGYMILAIIVVTVTGIALWWRIRSVRLARQPAPLAETLIRYPEPFFLRREQQQLCIRWQPDQQPVMIRCGTAPDAITQQYPIAPGQSALSFAVQPYTRYFLEITLADGKRIHTAERFLPVEHIPNLRDIGGYPAGTGQRVRMDRVYRSGRLSDASPADLAWLQAQGVRWICDLRSHSEMISEADRIPAGARYSHLPPVNPDHRAVQVLRLLFDRNFVPDLLPDLYTRVMLETNAPLFRTLFEQLANADNLPAIIHCTAGKDRTGITSALLLALLGVPDDIICADYTLSNYEYPFFASVTGKLFPGTRFFGLADADMRHWLIADSAVMADTLAYIRRNYGSVESYLLKRAGISAAAIHAIRAHLLESAP